MKERDGNKIRSSENLVWQVWKTFVSVKVDVLRGIFVGNRRQRMSAITSYFGIYVVHLR